MSKFSADAKLFGSLSDVTVEVDPVFAEIAPVVASSSAEYGLTAGVTAASGEASGSGIQGLLNGTLTPADVLTALDNTQQK